MICHGKLVQPLHNSTGGGREGDKYMLVHDLPDVASSKS